MMRAICLVVFILGHIACVSDPVITYAYPEDLQGKTRTLAPGIYETSVDIVAFDRSAYRLRLTIDVRQGAVSLTGMGVNSDSAWFKISESRRLQTASLTIYKTQLEPLRDQIEEVYVQMRPLFFVGLDVTKEGRFANYDLNGIPRQITWKTTAHNLTVAIDSYKLY